MCFRLDDIQIFYIWELEIWVQSKVLGRIRYMLNRTASTEVWNYEKKVAALLALTIPVSSVSIANYWLPGYPGIGSFFQYSNTRVIGSSTRALKLNPNVKDILQVKN